MLHFNDGITIDTRGAYRALHLKDGWYVIGYGMCTPVADYAAATAEIQLLTVPIRSERLQPRGSESLSDPRD